MNKRNISIIGATGNVGRKLVELCVQRKLADNHNLQLLASKKSHGSTLCFHGKSFVVSNLENYSFKDCHLAIFATESDISKKYIPTALSCGVKVIDASSAYRLEPKVPLIVPPVNAHLISDNHTLYAHANCLASPISVVLKPLHDHNPVKRVLITTFQSVSGAGKTAMDELFHETKSHYDGSDYVNKCFPRKIAFNVIPQVDKILDDGYTYEEFKIINELKKVISTEIHFAATSVRVPVMVGHSISLAVEFHHPIGLDEVTNILTNGKGIKLSNTFYSTPVEVEGSDDVFVGRIRKDISVQNGYLMWLVSDNLRRGAALDEVEMAEAILGLR